MAQIYKPEQLRYSAHARCRCGAGLAYPQNDDLRGHWECSAILTGDATPSLDHDGPLPFAYWSVVSEAQRSRANDATTRPGGHVDAERLEKVLGERDVMAAGYPAELLANPKAVR